MENSGRGMLPSQLYKRATGRRLPSSDGWTDSDNPTADVVRDRRSSVIRHLARRDVTGQSRDLDVFEHERGRSESSDVSPRALQQTALVDREILGYNVEVLPTASTCEHQRALRH